MEECFDTKTYSRNISNSVEAFDTRFVHYFQ